MLNYFHGREFLCFEYFEVLLDVVEVEHEVGEVFE